jgi:hypothetical protein
LSSIIQPVISTVVAPPLVTSNQSLAKGLSPLDQGATSEIKIERPPGDVGGAVGGFVGFGVGALVGNNVGLLEGPLVGDDVGIEVIGELFGGAVGAFVGVDVGKGVGDDVGFKVVVMVDFPIVPGEPVSVYPGVGLAELKAPFTPTTLNVEMVTPVRPAELSKVCRFGVGVETPKATPVCQAPAELKRFT